MYVLPLVLLRRLYSGHEGQHLGVCADCVIGV
jgi:hypothetical protein